MKRVQRFLMVENPAEAGFPPVDMTLNGMKERLEQLADSGEDQSTPSIKEMIEWLEEVLQELAGEDQSTPSIKKMKKRLEELKSAQMSSENPSDDEDNQQ